MVGRVRLTHNARQASGTYTYTNYDALGRVIEVGEESGLGTTPQAYIDANASTSRGTDVTITFWSTTFDIPSPWLALTQRNLRNRISRTMTDVDSDTTTTADQVNTYYSYDPHGNVEWLVQALPATAEGLSPLVLCTEYEYDLISGKVKEVRLQPGRTDQFTQRYSYDHDQRITSVATSRDGITWEHEAAYSYFAHGPLKRMELGQDSVQGIDYVYTINGWLKGINMPSLNPDHDPGGDGHTSGANIGFARDAFGMILGYHERDFVRTGSMYDSATAGTSSWHVPNPTFLYNGNISSWAWNSRRSSGGADTALASVYHYDLLNRIRTDSVLRRPSSSWESPGSYWHSSYTYDGNGNILTLNRKDVTASSIDALTYAYTSGTNKLVNINDYQGASTGADIGDQDGNNYAYDATGNMTQDTAAGIEAGGIVWSPYNKIKSITKMGEDTTSKLVYLYDATGNRILKRYYKPHNTLKNTTWYARDAQGNTLATYTKPSDSTTARQKEVMLYGSTRLAVAETHAPYSDSETDTLGIFDRVSSRTLGEKRYELTDHLGNVRATVSDVVIDHSGNLDAEISTRTDYYPFGMIMGGRNSSLDDTHRYGFNGKENDNEVKGEGVQQDYGFRIYDARVARFLSVDPLAMEYPWYTPYQFAGNTPIQAIDLDGLEPFFIPGTFQKRIQGSKDDDNIGLMNSIEKMAAVFGWNHSPVDWGFTWNSDETGGNLNNGLLHNADDRAVAAEAFANYVAMNHVEGEVVSIYAYSHGGNVAIQAIPLLAKKLPGVAINLVTLFTPAENQLGNRENPRTISELLTTHVHFHSRSDNVVPWALNLQASRTYDQHPFFKSIHGTHDKLIQVEVDNHITAEKNGSPQGHGSLFYPKRMAAAAKEAVEKLEIIQRSEDEED